MTKLIAATLLAAAVAHAAAAATTTATFAANLPVDFKPAALAPSDANGIWVAGFSQYGGSGLVLARYRTNGSVAFTRAVPGYYEAGTLQLATLPDGGVVVAGSEASDSACTLRRYDAAGTLRWNTALPNNARCASLSVDGAGGVWLKTAPIYRLSADGAVGAQVADNGLTTMTLLGDPAAAGAYLVGFDGGPNGTTLRAVVERVGEHGDVVWKATPSSAPSSAFGVAAVVDGGVYAFGGIRPDAAHNAFYGVGLTRDGSVQWQHTNDPLSSNLPPYYFAWAAGASADGHAFVSFPDSTSSSGLSLAKTGPNGAFAWSAPAPASCGYYSTLHTAANGDALLTCWPDNTLTAYELRVSAQGSTIFSHSIADVASVATQTLADSTEFSLVQHQPILDANGNPLGGSAALDFDHLDPAGNPAAAPQASGVVALGGDLAASAFGADGSAYIAVDAFEDSHSELARLAPDGHVLWRRSLNHWIGHGNYQTSLAVTASAVCTVDEGGVACYAIGDGSALGATQFTGGGSGPPPEGSVARVLDDGSLLVFYYGDSGHQLSLSASGNVLRDTSASYTSRLGNINGSGAGVFGGYATPLVRVARDGTSQAVTLPAASGSVQQAYLADDGSLLVFGTTDTAAILTRLDAQNSVLWTRTLSAAPPAPEQRYDVASGFVVRGASAYFVLGRDYEYDDPLALHPYTVQKVSLSDGSVAWSALFMGDGSAFPSVLPDSTGQNVLIVGGAPPNRVRTQLLNAASGAIADERMEDCAADRCTLVASALGQDGALRSVADAITATDGHIQRVLHHAAATAAPAAIRVDQPGIAGAWYAPYESGQGFSIDYIAAANTVFMPWFTYTTDGGNSPAGLSWYTLQGAATNGARNIDLAIAGADAGNFAIGSVGVHAVGSAQLRFTDCSNATLVYQFNPGINDGASGTITLQRLTPSSQPCALADGSSSAAQAPLAAAQGFEARQSGAWYDPATSGQGLEITVLPAGNGSNGLLFAAWFTFDPSGAADEPTQRHWFTLQGDLAAATNGAVSLPILRTIGGSFDAQPTGNTVQVGTATLAFSACDTAQLDYRFDNSDVAHAFAGLSGTIHLTRIGGCAAP